MDKQLFTQILECSLLLFDGMSQEELQKLDFDMKVITKAQYITNFAKTYKP